MKLESNQDIIYPSINLFQYHLHEGLGDSEENKKERKEAFYSICPDIFKYLPNNIKPDCEFGWLYVSKDKQKGYNYTSLHLKDLDKSKDWDGFYYPVQIGDTYCMQSNFSGKLCKDPYADYKNLTTAFEFLNKDFKEIMLISPKKENEKYYAFGKTYLLNAFIVNSHFDKMSIAKSCCEQITGKSYKLQGCGQWLGGDLFEFWETPSSYTDLMPDIINKYPHIFVWLFPAGTPEEIQETARKIESMAVSNHWIQFCHDRHKIFYAYFNSRFIKNHLKQSNSQIDKISQQATSLSQKTSLNELRELLLNASKQLLIYTGQLQSLEDQQHTIDIDLHNYRLQCQSMAKMDSSVPPDLDFLQNFVRIYSNKYLRQIKADRAHFSSGVMVLQNLNQTIQSTIQIVQAKNDKTTNLFIASFAIGVALSQLISSILLIQYPPSTGGSIPFYITTAFWQSVAFASIVPVFMLLIPWCWEKINIFINRKH
jgi:hypothetical protein